MTSPVRLWYYLIHPSHAPIMLLGAIVVLAGASFLGTFGWVLISHHQISDSSVLTGEDAEQYLLNRASPEDFKDPNYLAQLKEARAIGDASYYDSVFKNESTIVPEKTPETKTNAMESHSRPRR